MPKDMTDPAYLGVESSLTGRRWVGPGASQDRAAQALVQMTDVAQPVAQVLARLGVPAEGVEGYLSPTLRELLPDPRSLKDMEIAASRFLQAVKDNEAIAIFADYDVDGGSSAALLIDWLRQMGRQATLYVPDRIDEGYGPNETAMAALAKDHDLIICVDCGTLSHGPIAAAFEAEVVVLDHHLGGETLPPALAIVNPNRTDEDGTLGFLCAAGVVFLMLVEANRQLRTKGTSGPDLMAMLDLVALATVADVAPLIGANRALVRQGLTVMTRRTRPGLVALADVAGLDAPPTPYHLGFLLGPRVNAGGRIGKADLGARLLASDDPHEASAMAEKLDMLNAERRDVEASVRRAAMEQAEARGLDGPLVWAAGEGWHPGVVGIVASRLKDATNRPAVVIGLENGQGKGSGRSVSGVDLGASIQRLAAEGLIEKGGGHKMAAGLSLAAEGLEAAMMRLADLLAKQGSAEAGPKAMRLDGVLQVDAVSPELITQIEAAGPYGAGAPGPRFAIPQATITFSKPVGETHLRFSCSSGGASKLNGIAFGAFDCELGEAIMNAGRARMHLAGRLELNHWGGRTSAQMRLEDASYA